VGAVSTARSASVILSRANHQATSLRHDSPRYEFLNATASTCGM
jgi:hypothetical protein